MCRLLGIVSDGGGPGQGLYYDFLALSRRGRVPTVRSAPWHRDGWGFVSAGAGGPEYLGRSPRDIAEDPSVETALDLALHARGPLVLGHMRKTSGSSPSFVNTHPFIRRGWAFCHNGTVFDHGRIPLGREAPEGETDSERVFLYLLDRIGGARGTAAVPRLLEGLGDLRRLVEYSSLTFFLSDGRLLAAYREFDPRCRRGGYRSARELEVYYTLYRSRNPWGEAICSEPLPSARAWRPIANREILICDLRRRAWTSRRLG